MSELRLPRVTVRFEPSGAHPRRNEAHRRRCRWCTRIAPTPFNALASGLLGSSSVRWHCARHHRQRLGHRLGLGVVRAFEAGPGMAPALRVGPHRPDAVVHSPVIGLRCARRIRRCPPNRPPSELAQRAALRRCTATTVRARSASSSVWSGGARRYDDALVVAPGTEWRARWRSTTSSRRRSCATTSSSTGGWAPSPPSSASTKLTVRRIGACAETRHYSREMTIALIGSAFSGPFSPAARASPRPRRVRK